MWLKEYENTKQSANDILTLIQARSKWAGSRCSLTGSPLQMPGACIISCSQSDNADQPLVHPQDRNAQHANGGADASRLTAQARRNLALLGTAVETLADKLETLDSV